MLRLAALEILNHLLILTTDNTTDSEARGVGEGSEKGRMMVLSCLPVGSESVVIKTLISFCNSPEQPGIYIYIYIYSPNNHIFLEICYRSDPSHHRI